MPVTSVETIEKRLKRSVPKVVAWNVHEYREVAVERVVPGDVCLEVGCCGGVTTATIRDAGCAYVVGIDKNEMEVENAVWEMLEKERMHAQLDLAMETAKLNN